MCKFDNILFDLQNSTLLKWLLKFMSWYGLSLKKIEHI